MNAQQILESDDFKRCEAFHGHVCGGLAIGYLAATAGLDWLREKRALDEELVAIVETDACCVDAIQVLTGCTFGKGNLVYRDYGKMGFTFFNRRTGQGVRLAMKPDAFRVNDRQIALFKKTRDGSITDAEKQELEALGLQTDGRGAQHPGRRSLQHNPGVRRHARQGANRTLEALRALWRTDHGIQTGGCRQCVGLPRVSDVIMAGMKAVN